MRIDKLRFEAFGGIAGTIDPVNLIWFSREQLRELGYDGGPAWQCPDPRADIGPQSEHDQSPHGALVYPRSVPPWMLSSKPVEAELAITTRCPRSCPCCYAGGSPSGQDVPYDILAERLDYLATLDPFHLAFSGGEPLVHPALFSLAEHARELGMLPSTTTSGPLVSADWANTAAELFGRVNVSVDFPGGPRGYSYEDTTESFRALGRLSRAGVTAGVTFILTRHNLERLPELFWRAASAGAESILLLRLKPSGRGHEVYREASVLPSQMAGLLQQLPYLCTETGLDFHLDCALASIVLSSPAVPDDRLGRWAASGCIAGSLLVTIDAAGIVRPCSHLDADICRAPELPHGWLASPQVRGIRTRWTRQSGNCATCPRLMICGGGCAAVNQGLGLALEQPDPDLPCAGEG